MAARSSSFQALLRLERTRSRPTTYPLAPQRNQARLVSEADAGSYAKSTIVSSLIRFTTSSMTGSGTTRGAREETAESVEEVELPDRPILPHPNLVTKASGDGRSL